MELNNPAEEFASGGLFGSQQVLERLLVTGLAFFFVFSSSSSLPSSLFFFLRIRKLLNVGVQVKARASEVNSETPRVKASARKNVP